MNEDQRSDFVNTIQSSSIDQMTLSGSRLTSPWGEGGFAVRGCALLLCVIVILGCDSSEQVRSLSVSDQVTTRGDGSVLSRRYTIAFEPPSGFFRNVGTVTLLDGGGKAYDMRELSVNSDGGDVTKISAVFEIPAGVHPLTIRLDEAELHISSGRLVRRVKKR